MNLQDYVKEIATKYLKRTRRSGVDNIMGVCPFHRKADGSEERHPSFSMSLSRGVYQCFTCGSTGNMYTFLRDVGLPALVIQNQYGVLLEELKKGVRPKHFDPLRPDVLELEPLDESALGFFDYCPVQMVEEFGFPEELLRRMDIGFDIKHNRITFPLRDYQGNLLGISGRDVTGQGARFKIYDKEYEAFGLPAREHPRKGIILWNAHRVYPSVYFSTKSFVIAVEGFKGCLRVMQAGYPNVVALLTKRVSDHQKWIFESMGAPVYLMLDNDEAGQWGLEKTAPWLSKSLTVKVVEYPAEQPSELQLDQVREAIETARHYHLWKDATWHTEKTHQD